MRATRPRAPTSTAGCRRLTPPPISRNMRYAQPERAKQRVRFMEQYRSYVINYNLGKDMVRRFVESRPGVSGNPAKRWTEFEKLLSSPRLPSGLQ